MEMDVDFGLDSTNLNFIDENKKVSVQNVSESLYDIVEMIITYALRWNVNKIKIDRFGLSLAVRDSLEKEIKNRNLKITVC